MNCRGKEALREISEHLHLFQCNKSSRVGNCRCNATTIIAQSERETKMTTPSNAGEIPANEEFFKIVFVWELHT